MLTRKIVLKCKKITFRNIAKNGILHFLSVILEEIIVDTKFGGHRRIGKPHDLYYDGSLFDTINILIIHGMHLRIELNSR